MDASREHFDEIAAVKRSENFTGDVWGEQILTGIEATAVNRVSFAPAARTYWHSHDDGQLLHITAGRGEIGTRDGQRVTVGPGDTVWAPPGEEHYHAAHPHRPMTHLAISFGPTQWLSEVTQEELDSGGG